MQIKLYTIPIMGGEQLLEEMNVFLRSKKVLQIEQHFSQEQYSAYWCFSIRYIADGDKYKMGKANKRIDYRELLDTETFARFSAMREIRKKIAEQEAVPAYAIFTNEELAALAKMEEVTLVKMKTIKGIGEKKIEKYGQHFVTQETDREKS